jgi:hypothetical protein
VFGREGDVRIRRVVWCGVVLLVLAVYAGPGAAVPLDRNQHRTAIAEFILSTFEDAPRARTARIRERIFALRGIDPLAPTEGAPPAPLAISTLRFGPLSTRSFRASGAGRFFATFRVAPEAGALLPEPATGTLFAAGALLIAALGRRRRAH